MMAKTKNPVSCCCREIDDNAKNQKIQTLPMLPITAMMAKTKHPKPVEKTNPFFCV
jgi:hypothetical protein